MESYEDILKRMEETYERESGHSARDVSDTGLRLRVLAGELYRLEAEYEWVAREAFPHTATGEWLDRHGALRGVSRREETRAKGTLTFNRYLPLSFDVTIPRGTVCALPGEDPVEYETVEDGVLRTGELTVTIPAQAVLGGPSGNAAAGTVNTLVTPPTGINYVTNKVAFTGGADREDDGEYRARVLAAYRDLPTGANAAYYRDIAQSIAGVSAAGAKPRANGAGTVTVYVWGEGGAPSGTVLAAVQKELNSRREVGVTVTAAAAATRPVNVTVRFQTLPGVDFQRAKADVEQAVRSYFAGLTVGSPLYVWDLKRAVLNAAPAFELEFGASLRDLGADPGIIPVLGNLTVEEITA